MTLNVTDPLLPDLWLFHDEDECADFLTKQFGDAPLIEGAKATTFYSEGECVVLMLPTDETWDEQAAVLVHEAWHVVCGHLEYLREDEAGEETVAYLIQAVSLALFDAHREWLESR